MKGWKTWAGGAGLIFTGIGVILKGFSEGTFDGMTEGIGLISSGLAVIGIGHKIEKAAL